MTESCLVDLHSWYKVTWLLPSNHSTSIWSADRNVRKKINWIFFGLFVMIINNIFHNVEDGVQKIKRLKLPINNMLFWLHKRKANFFYYSMIKYTISTDKHVLIFCLFTFRIDKVWNKILSVGIQWTSVRFGENLLL